MCEAGVFLGGVAFGAALLFTILLVMGGLTDRDA